MSARRPSADRPPAWELLKGRSVFYWRQPPLAGLKGGEVARVHPRRQDARIRPVGESGSELVPLGSIRSVWYRRRELPVEAFLHEEARRLAAREEARNKPATGSSSTPPPADQ